MQTLWLVIFILALSATSQCRERVLNDRTNSKATTPQASIEILHNSAPLPIEFKVDIHKVKNIAISEFRKFETDGSMELNKPIGTLYNLEKASVAAIIHVDQRKTKRKLVFVFFDDLKNPEYNAFVVLEKTGGQYVPFQRSMSIQCKSNILAEIRMDKAFFDAD